MSARGWPFVTFCGCLGQLSVVWADLSDADGCLVWRTDAQLLKCSGQTAPRRGSLLELACDVAELYHCKHALRLPELPREVEVIWLELAADEALLVFLKPVSRSTRAWLG